MILESSSGMAKKLNITAVAEGLKPQADWNFSVRSAAISRRATSSPGRWNQRLTGLVSGLEKAVRGGR